MNLVPMTIKPTAMGERSMDIFSRLLDSRIVLLTGEVTDESAELIVAQLLYLDDPDTAKPISLYINSPGGSVSAGLAIYDTMQCINSPVNTYCMGVAASMGAFLLSAGVRRYCMPNAEVMIHQPLGGAQGQCTDVEIRARHLSDIKKRLNAILAKNTKKSIEEIAKDTDRDNWLTAEQALQYGLIDEIMPIHQKRP